MGLRWEGVGEFCSGGGVGEMDGRMGGGGKGVGWVVDVWV